MGGYSCSEGCGFESQHHILDGHFFTYICCKNCNDVCLKRHKIKNKRDRGWPIKKERNKDLRLFRLKSVVVRVGYLESGTIGIYSNILHFKADVVKNKFNSKMGFSIFWLGGFLFLPLSPCLPRERCFSGSIRTKEQTLVCRSLLLCMRN